MRKNKTLCERVRSMDVLVGAWHAIRRNAETSRTASTKQQAREFGQDLPRNLRRIQDRLRNGYRFEKAYGATPPKGPGKAGKRPIVVAALPDRIVQRAILDVLQQGTDLPNIQRVLSTRTSIGGIPGRGVDCAIELFDGRCSAGDQHVAGSDIAGFFTKIPKAKVLEFLQRDINEPAFLQLMTGALAVELSNAHALGAEDRKLFPTGPDGVAQGCPLSALAGNIVLEEFDRRMNDPARGLTCIRYIDDFVITGPTAGKVQKGMVAAKDCLSALGMDIYDPEKSPSKAFSGQIGEPHDFLGYCLIPGSYPPSQRAQLQLLERVDNLIRAGQLAIRKVVKGRALTSHDRCYAQTIAAIDNTVRGWRGSFRSSKSVATFKALDKQIERRLKDFETFFRQHTNGCGQSLRRRAMGVSLLT